METKLDTYNNSWYKKEIGASRFKRACWYLTNAIFFINPVLHAPGFKVRLLRAFGAKIGVGVVIKPSVNIKYPWKLSVGNYAWIGEGAWIDNLAAVTIGDNACLSQGAMLLTGNHDYTKSTFDLMLGEIVIENGAWIGARSMVCPGVRCGSHAVLAAGSTATKELEPYKIYQGNPAGFIKDRVII